MNAPAQQCYFCKKPINETTGRCECDKQRDQCAVCGEWLYHRVMSEHMSAHRWTERRRERREAARRKVCPLCGNPFQAQRCDALFCSSACRQSAYRARVTLIGANPMLAPVTVTAL